MRKIVLISLAVLLLLAAVFILSFTVQAFSDTTNSSGDNSSSSPGDSPGDNGSSSPGDSSGDNGGSSPGDSSDNNGSSSSGNSSGTTSKIESEFTLVFDDMIMDNYIIDTTSCIEDNGDYYYKFGLSFSSINDKYIRLSAPLNESDLINKDDDYFITLIGSTYYLKEKSEGAKTSTNYSSIGTYYSPSKYVGDVAFTCVGSFSSDCGVFTIWGRHKYVFDTYIGFRFNSGAYEAYKNKQGYLQKFEFSNRVYYLRLGDSLVEPFGISKRSYVFGACLDDFYGISTDITDPSDYFHCTVGDDGSYEEPEL